MAADINRWWLGDPSQRFWMEATLREDIGTDLHAPQTGKGGTPYWGYSLVMEVEDGDIVFHYATARKQIESWSVAVGGRWEGETVWAARGTASRGIAPTRQPGYYRGLHGPFDLEEPLTLDELRDGSDRLAEAFAAVEANHRGNLYKPFQIRGDGVRAGQGYLFKLPAEVVQAFPKLARAAEIAPSALPDRGTGDGPGPPSLGRTYRRADEELAVAERDPLEVDPAVVERGTRSHARLQNLLAAHVEELGYEPLSPAEDDPLYDLLWRDGSGLCVAEVKSLTENNEERQLRLGLGQLLRYRQRLSPSGGDEVRAFLVCEREPRDPTWQELCDDLDVVLVWPEVLGERIR